MRAAPGVFAQPGDGVQRGMPVDPPHRGVSLVAAAVDRHGHLRHAEGREVVRELLGHVGAVRDEFDAASRPARLSDHVQKPWVDRRLTKASERQREPVRRGVGKAR